MIEEQIWELQRKVKELVSLVKLLARRIDEGDIDVQREVEDIISRDKLDK